MRNKADLLLLFFSVYTHVKILNQSFWNHLCNVSFIWITLFWKHRDHLKPQEEFEMGATFTYLCIDDDTKHVLSPYYFL